MKTITKILLPVLFFIQNVFAQQQFQLMMHPGLAQEAKFMNKVTGNGYLLASDYTDLSGEKSILLTRMDEQFNVTWHRQIGVPGTNERVNSFYQDSIGNIFIAGYVMDSLAIPINNMLVIKTDSSGNLIWNKIFNYGNYNSRAERILESSTGSVYVLGNSEDNYAGSGNIYYMTAMIKLNSLGAVQWDYTYTSSIHSNTSVEMLPSADGKLIVGGFSPGLNDMKAGITKFDTTGVKLWDNRWWISGFNNFPLGSLDDITFSPGGGYTLCGFRGIDTVSVIKNYIMKCDNAGNQVNQYRYSIPFNNIFLFMDNLKCVQTNDGGYAVAGTLYNFSTTGLALMKVDSNLVPQWCRLYDMNAVNKIGSLLQTPDGGYIISGTQNDKILLIKTDTSGFSLCNEQTATVFYQPEAATTPSPLSGFQLPAFVPLAYIPAVSLQTNVADTVCYTTTAVAENDLIKSVAVFPNPFTSEISVTIQSNKANNSEFTVKNIFGETVFYKQENILAEAYTERMDLKNLSSGIYFVEILSGKERSVKKIVKQ